MKNQRWNLELESQKLCVRVLEWSSVPWIIRILKSNCMAYYKVVHHHSCGRLSSIIWYVATLITHLQISHRIQLHIRVLRPLQALYEDVNVGRGEEETGTEGPEHGHFHGKGSPHVDDLLANLIRNDIYNLFTSGSNAQIRIVEILHISHSSGTKSWKHLTRGRG